MKPEQAAMIRHNAAGAVREVEKLPIVAKNMDCTMTRAQALALPASLGDAAAALGVKIGKDWDGWKLMMKMCKPLKWVDGRPVYHDDEAS